MAQDGAGIPPLRDAGSSLGSRITGCPAGLDGASRLSLRPATLPSG